MRVEPITVDRMEKLEALASEKYGIEPDLLMENAGYQLANFVRRETEASSISVFVGPGNNGGDGLVAARRLAYWGMEVELICVPGFEADLEDRRPWIESADVKLKTSPEGDKDLIIDALLGSGQEGPLRSPISEMVDDINESGSRVLSADVPTGVDPGSGRFFDPAVMPDFVLTFGFPFLGLEELDSEIWLADISFPGEFYENRAERSIFADDSLVRIDE